MKRCPQCNQTFQEEWLGFCTEDGTALVDDIFTAASEPLPPIVAPTADDAPAWIARSADPPPSSPEWQPPQRAVPEWQPPPPPYYAQPQSKSLATAAMILGIISITVGWLCLGPLPGIASIILGAVALSQIKKTPDRVGGKPMALTGVVTGSITVLLWIGLMIFYIFIGVMANA